MADVLKNAPNATGGNKPNLSQPGSTLSDGPPGALSTQLENSKLKDKEEGKNEEEEKSSLKIRIELDLDVEVHLTARVKGTVVIGLLVDEGLKRLAESAEEFARISDKIPKLQLDLDF